MPDSSDGTDSYQEQKLVPAVRSVLLAARDELRRWGWGDMHYGTHLRQEQSVVDALDAIQSVFVHLKALEDLVAEVRRHRNANLVRVVLGGADQDAVQEWVTECINQPNFDRVPWMIARDAVEKEKRNGSG